MSKRLAPTPDFLSLLRPLARELGISLSDAQAALLERHYAMLIRWNRVMNLTGVRSPELIVRRHFGESLFLASCLDLKLGTLADVGSGGGFPGFPIAVLCPELTVSLVESVGKKVAFLKEVSRGVANVRVVAGRFERVPGRFDWVVLRGVAPRSILGQLSGRADRVAILTSSKQVPGLLQAIGCDARTSKVPWDQSSQVLLFHVKQPPW